MQYINPRLARNNFDLLRLLFAGTVCLAHAYTLSGFEQLGWIAKFLSSSVAVKAFFVVSGFLIFMSFERSSSIKSYAIKRIRRIYPAYFVAVLSFAIILILASSKNTTDYFSFDWIKYIAANLSFLNFLMPTLPGVFDFNNYNAVNGALWTLKIEVLFYFSVPFFIVLFRKFSHFPVLVTAYCLSVAYTLTFQAIAQKTGSTTYLELSRQLPGQLSYFLAGAFFYYYLPLFENRSRYFLVAAIAILIFNTTFPLPILEPFALATIVIYSAMFLYIGNFGKYGDFSYGMYILHFPIIQLILHKGWFNDSPWLFLIAIISITLLAAITLWHFVEKRFLLRANHYIAENSPSQYNPH